LERGAGELVFAESTVKTPLGGSHGRRHN